MSIKKKICMILLIIVSIFAVSFASFSYWAVTEGGAIFWVNSDNSYPVNEWKLIDDDDDGIGYYYYFNENGFLLIDDITPDYMLVDAFGRRIDYDGNQIAVSIKNISMEEGEEEIFSEEILEQIKAEQDIASTNYGVFSSGQSIISVEIDDTEGPKPSDNIVNEANPDGTARWLLGPNVKLKKEKDAAYDATMPRKMPEYITSGQKYSKKVNGTTFLKAKWKEVMEMKGAGASIVFENPNHNFNKLKGRIATHYFSYSERTTQCTLYIINEDNGEELYSTSGFNYNGGCAFDCTFPKKTNAIRFELEVTGQYTSRVCYLRNCEFGFDKEAYEEEKYEDEVEEAYRAVYGTESDAEYDEDEEFDDSMGEVPLEGEDPGARYRRINGLTEESETLPLDYDEDDDSITEAMRASISELRAKMEKEDEERNKVSGPAFDKKLKVATASVGPSGFSNMIPGFEGD